LASLAVMLFSILSIDTSMESWFWRIPFVLGLVFVLLGYGIRRSVSETPVFQKLKSAGVNLHVSLLSIVVQNRTSMLQAIGTTIIHTVGVYFIFMYMPVYFKTVLNLSYGVAMGSTVLSLLIMIILLPCGGLLADIYGRKPILMYGSAVLTLCAYPCFMLINSGSVLLIFMGHQFLAIIFAILHAPLSVLYVELFPPEIRYRASAIAYNTCICLFGGITPLVCTWLVSYTGNSITPIFWLIFSGIVSTMVVLTLKETKSELILGDIK
jgi:MHS family proline/betaine transporter-like MFS transporter